MRSPVFSMRAMAVPGSSLRMQRASGATITDTDGNTYIDMAMGGGTCILGHANPLVVEAVNKQMCHGSLFAVANPYAEDFAELLGDAIPGCDQFVFASTGSEAILRAIRLARAVTDKKKIGVFSGGWHGSHDQVLVEEDYSRDSENAPAMMPKSAGILDEVLENLVFLPYNTEAAFGLIRDNKDDLAAVMIEPAQGSNPRDDVEGFLRDLRDVTRTSGILLIFDEVITGFRLALGGAQERFGISADIVTYGKTLGGGLPIGVVSGAPEVLSYITTDHGGEKPPFYNGGTFSANPLTVAAGLAVVRYLSETREETYARLERAGETVRAALNDYCLSERGARACDRYRLHVPGDLHRPAGPLSPRTGLDGNFLPGPTGLLPKPVVIRGARRHQRHQFHFPGAYGGRSGQSLSPVIKTPCPP